jgi:hypothetical protein
LSNFIATKKKHYYKTQHTREERDLRERERERERGKSIGIEIWKRKRGEFFGVEI